jgi:hypothetical protein
MLTASINKSHSDLSFENVHSLYIIFKEWSKRHIKTWRIVCKLFYCDHPADFILKLRMIDDLCFADRTNGSRIQEMMIISVYKERYKDIKNFISLYFEPGNVQQNEADVFRFTY